MTDQNHKIQTIMSKRLALIQEIATANSEQLRLNQIAGGFLVLDQKDDEDGTEIGASEAEHAANADAMAACMIRIEALETELATVDQELSAATNGDGT